MQPLLDKLRWLSDWHVGYTIGLVLFAALLMQGLVQLYGYARRIGFERQQQRLWLEQMGLSIKTAMLRCIEAEQARQVWNGFRKFQIAKKVRECEDVFSFYLAPHDGKPIAGFKPGQYLTFQLPVAGQPKPVVRCYSISDYVRDDNQYRVTIKKVPPPHDQPEAPPGLASSYFCDTLNEGDILDVKAPAGHFYLDLAKEIPVVLISGGVGITPMLSMLNAVLASGSKREVWFFYGARNSEEHIQKKYLEQIAAAHDQVRLHVCYSKPKPTDAEAKDFQHKGHVTVSLLKDLLPSNNYDFFICGPPRMMADMVQHLGDWGVPKNRIFTEAFGAPTRKKIDAPQLNEDTQVFGKIKVSFSRSGKGGRWDPSCESLLDFAEKQGVAIDSGCRSGSCGTCLVALKSGQVKYLGDHNAPAEEGSCLTCVCKPETDVTLDA